MKIIYLIIFLLIIGIPGLQAHENEIWKDIKVSTGPVVRNIPCGLGYYLYKRPDGTKTAILMADHLHFIEDKSFDSCEQLFDYLHKEGK